MSSRTTVAVIPARGGSKGLPGKNLLTVGGRSLIARAIEACRAAVQVDDVVVTTDSDAIAAQAEAHGALVVRRPVELAGDEATSESALLHALDQLPAAPDVVVFVQCTSPFIEPAAIDRAVLDVAAGACDSAFAAAPTHRFVWREGQGGFVGVNHDHHHRERRQDRPFEVLETGAFYVFRHDAFRAAGHRFHGAVRPALVDAATSLEIDDVHDLELARRIDERASLGAPPSSIGPIEALVMDFDGVHTDNSALLDEFGVESVRIDRSDGMGIAQLRRAGLPMLILSTEQNVVVGRRAEKLEIECIAGCDDKLPTLRGWCDDRGLDLDRVAYVGNDVNDLDCLRAVGWPIVVADAHPAVLTVARVTTRAVGGRGAVREIADRVLAGLPVDPRTADRLVGAVTP